MKRLSILFLTYLCVAFSLSANSDDNDKTKLTIRNESFMGINSKDVYRDLSYNVIVELTSAQSLLKISHYGIGDAELYLIDNHNQIVDQQTIFEGVYEDYLDLQGYNGNYVLVIWSSNYYGEVYFTL